MAKRNRGARQGDATGDLSLKDIAASGTVDADVLPDNPDDEDGPAEDAEQEPDTNVNDTADTPSEPDPDRTVPLGTGGYAHGKASAGNARFIAQKEVLKDLVHRVDSIQVHDGGVTLGIGAQTVTLNDPALVRAFGAEHPSLNNWLLG